MSVTALASKRYTVLQDLSFATLGFSGIPQDTRLMFKTFARHGFRESHGPAERHDGRALDRRSRPGALTRPRSSTSSKPAGSCLPQPACR